MAEAASATATVTAGSIRNAIIVEQTIALASPGATVADFSGGIPVAIAEAATVNSAQDADITSASAVAVIDGTFVKATITSTCLAPKRPIAGR